MFHSVLSKSPREITFFFFPFSKMKNVGAFFHEVVVEDEGGSGNGGSVGGKEEEEEEENEKRAEEEEEEEEDCSFEAVKASLGEWLIPHHEVRGCTLCLKDLYENNKIVFTVGSIDHALLSTYTVLVSCQDGGSPVRKQCMFCFENTGQSTSFPFIEKCPFRNGYYFVLFSLLWKTTEIGTFLERFPQKAFFRNLLRKSRCRNIRPCQENRLLEKATLLTYDVMFRSTLQK